MSQQITEAQKQAEQAASELYVAALQVQSRREHFATAVEHLAQRFERLAQDVRRVNDRPNKVDASLSIVNEILFSVANASPQELVKYASELQEAQSALAAHVQKIDALLRGETLAQDTTARFFEIVEQAQELIV